MNKYLLLAAALFAACAHSESRKNTLPEKPIETAVKSHKNILPTAQAAADMAAPHIRHLNIQPNFDAALFSVDAKTFLNNLQFTPAEKEQRYYFHGADQEHGSSEQAKRRKPRPFCWSKVKKRISAPTAATGAPFGTHLKARSSRLPISPQAKESAGA